MIFLKRAFVIITILITAGILFRGWFYRQSVTYKSIGLRTNFSAKDKKLITYIEDSMDNKIDPTIEQIIELGLSLTSNRLNYTANKNDIDPNKLISSNTAHCVGYATFFATTCNYLLQKHHLSDRWSAKPQIGQIYFLGTNIHNYFNSPFFKDHDFVTIENKTTGEILAVDPTVNDYLFIDFIKYTK
jgi:hypothetical protein